MHPVKEKLFERLLVLSDIHLDLDPVEAGLGELNKKFAECINQRSEATKWANKIVKALGDKKRACMTAQDLYDMKLNQLLANNVKVSEGVSKEERIASAKNMLKDIAKELNELKMDVSEWEDLLTCVNNCLKTLQNAKESLSKQQTIINYQIQLGEIDSSKYGSK